MPPRRISSIIIIQLLISHRYYDKTLPFCFWNDEWSGWEPKRWTTNFFRGPSTKESFAFWNVEYRSFWFKSHYPWESICLAGKLSMGLGKHSLSSLNKLASLSIHIYIISWISCTTFSNSKVFKCNQTNWLPLPLPLCCKLFLPDVHSFIIIFYLVFMIPELLVHNRLFAHIQTQVRMNKKSLKCLLSILFNTFILDHFRLFIQIW